MKRKQGAAISIIGFAALSCREPFSLHALVGLRKTFVDDVNLELHHGAQRNIIRHERHKSLNNLVDVVIAGVLDFAQQSATEICAAADEVFCRETEQAVFRVFLFALGGRVENQVDNSLVQSPCRREVEFEITSRHLMAACMVHGKGHFANGRAAVVLRYRSPSVAERVDTIAVVACNAYALANLLYAAVGITAEAVRVAVTLVEAEQERVVVAGSILVKQRQRIDGTRISM